LFYAVTGVAEVEKALVCRKILVADNNQVSTAFGKQPQRVAVNVTIINEVQAQYHIERKYGPVKLVKRGF